MSTFLGARACPPRRTLQTCLVAGICTLAGIAGPIRGFDAPAGAYAPVGPQATRGYFSGVPLGRVDMVNGNLTFSVTDLVLPGSAGMDLRIARAYRHQNGEGRPWSFSFTDVPLAVRIGFEFPTDLMMGDYSIKKLHCGIVAPYCITTDFWRYDSAARTLYLPDGRMATYASQGTGLVRLQRVEDPFGNRIEAYWPTSPGIHNVERVEQTVGGANGWQTRTVYFTYDGFGYPTIRYEDRTWTHTATSSQPPAGTGPGWEYTFSGFEDGSPTGTLLVRLPSGGTIAHAFTGEEGRSRVQAITTGGRAMASGTWQFGFTYDGFRIGTVTMPSGRALTYKHQAYAGPDEADWVLRDQTLSEGGNSASTQWTYEDVDFLPGPPAKPLKAPSTKVISQDGLTYTTQYDYNGAQFKDYLRPWRITETASNHSTARVTTRTFDYDFYRYLVTRIGSQAVEVAGESFSTSADYDNSSGFPTAQTQFGLTTQVAPDSGGNPATATDPLGHHVSAAFQWGVPRR